MKIKNILKALLVSCLFFVASSFVSGSVFAAPRLILDPAAKTVIIGQDVQINLNIDVGTSAVFGADALINLPSSDLTVKSVSKGDFFTDFGFSQSGSQLKIFGYFATAFQTKTGSGTFATITLTAARAAGTGNITFTCSANGSDTDIIDANGNNILACSSLNQSVITFSTGTTPTPTPVYPPGPTNGPTNACGGTCGSIYNCNVNLFCYQGYCRNPDCPSSATCGCPTVTPSPRPTVRPTVRATAKATPVVVTLAQATPLPTTVPTNAPAGSGAVSAVKPIYVWGILGAIAIIVILITVNALKKKAPPKINPPTPGTTQNYPVNPPPMVQ